MELTPGVYEISLNPCDKHQFWGNSERLDKFVQQFIKSMAIFKSTGVTFRLYLESSKPHINVNRSGKLPRYHYHGYMHFYTNEQIALFLDNILYRLSRVMNVTYNEHDKDHDQIREKEKGYCWADYCTKQQAIWEPFCKEKGIPYVIKETTMPIIFLKQHVFKPKH